MDGEREREGGRSVTAKSLINVRARQIAGIVKRKRKRPVHILVFFKAAGKCSRDAELFHSSVLTHSSL